MWQDQTTYLISMTGFEAVDILKPSIKLLILYPCVGFLVPVCALPFDWSSDVPALG